MFFFASNVWPFGHIKKHCLTNRICWANVLKCFETIFLYKAKNCLRINGLWRGQKVRHFVWKTSLKWLKNFFRSFGLRPWKKRSNIVRQKFDIGSNVCKAMVWKTWKHFLPSSNKDENCFRVNVCDVAKWEKWLSNKLKMFGKLCLICFAVSPCGTSNEIFNWTIKRDRDNSRLVW